MPNPKAALEIPFNDQTMEYRTKDPGSVETDDFYINDVAMRIAPSDITISKESYNHEWNTLRTSSSRSVKSGYGVARVSLRKIFQISVSEDEDRLSKIVAGLLATPFAVIHSRYLDNMLGSPDSSTPVADRKDQSRSFQPIMLAMVSMSFSTMGHASQPDCISAQFDFLWFNYLPFTNQIAFKSGPNLDQPGHAWQSPIWKAFYQPFYEKKDRLQFPHREGAYGRTTQFMWREFLMIPQGDSNALQASEEIVKLLKNKPKEVSAEYAAILNQATRFNALEGERSPELINQGVFDTLYRRLIAKGLLPKDLKKEIDGLSKGSITQASGDLLRPVLAKYIKGDFKSRRTSNSLDAAATILHERIKKIQDIKSRGDISFNTIEGGKYSELINAQAKYGGKAGTFSAGGLRLFGRKRFYNVTNQFEEVTTGNPGLGATIQQVTISFSNTLATIPMLAYRYPTIQHVGSIDARVNIVVNADNATASDLRTMYDRVETTALRFRQVPAGFTNLNIRNDFLNFFGYSEFLTEGLTVNTIQGQPGRSMVNISLVDAGITSDHKDPEQLTQEFLETDKSLFEDIWAVFAKNMRPREKYNANTKYLNSWTVFGNRNANNLDLEDLDYHKMMTTGTQIGDRNSAYLNLLINSIDAYNEFLESVHKNVFNSPGSEGNANLGALYSIQQNGEFGFIPGFEQLKKSIVQRNLGWDRAYRKEKKRSANQDLFQSSKSIAAQAKANKEAVRLGLEISPKDATKVQQRGAANRLRRIYDMGLNIYLTRMSGIFRRATSLFTLPQFQHLQKRKETLNINKGIMAYPDFQKQLSSVAQFAEGTEKTPTNATLLKYDPDCYFYYSMHHGGTSSPLVGVVDPYYITTAKLHSQKVFNEAQGAISRFFKNTYQEKLRLDHNHQGPYTALTEQYGGTELQSRLYKENNITNNTHSENIKKTVIPDANAKIPTNWYGSEKNPSIRAPLGLEHSADLNQLWTGIAAGSNTYGNQNLGNVDMAALNELGATGSRIENIPVKKSDLPFSMSWPIADPPPQSMLPKGYRFGYVRNSGRSHGGIDIPEPKRAKGKRGRNDGIYGMPVRAAADGIVSYVKDSGRSGGLWLQITHKGRWKTEYFHLESNSIAVRKGQRVQRGQYIASIGRTGNFHSPTHLHFQVRNPSYKVVDPYPLLPEVTNVSFNAKRRNIGAPYRNSPAPDKGVTSTIASPLNRAIAEFERDMYTGQAQSLMRAYPAFKLYFIEDDTKERKRLAFDDFFSYHAVRSIRVVRSRKIAADLCEIYLTNISGVLSNRKFRESRKSNVPHTKEGKPSQEAQIGTKAGTREENPIASLLLQEGMQIHLRLGYSSDPDSLPTVFNGQITEVQFSESDDLVRIVAQSFAIELQQDLKGIQKPTTKSSWNAFGWDFWGFTGDATTGRILEEMIAEPEVLHFGRWEPNRSINPSRDLLTSRWTFQPQPQDDNIFAPAPTEDLDKLGNGNLFKDLKYVIFRTTIWDIFQEMTLRHPNFIASVVPYEALDSQRSTMFFGLPNQLYFARDPKAAEALKDQKIKNELAVTQKKIIDGAISIVPKENFLKSVSKGLVSLVAPGLPGSAKAAASQYLMRRAVQASVAGKVIEKVTSQHNKQKRLQAAQDAGFVKPFRNYHLITSAQHLIQNNIRATSRDVANTIVIKYGGKIEIKDDDNKQLQNVAIEGNDEEFTLKLDNALPTEDIRAQMGQFVNVTNPDLAKRYALGLLCRNIKDIYKGEIVTIGNPKIKPYDICYLFDEYTDMVGAFEVEEVQHIFDQMHGFRTEIKPDMLVQAQEYSLLSSAEALGVVMEGTLRKIGMHNNALNKHLALDPYIMGHGINMFGGFLAQKLVNYTQLAQPVIMSPLQYRGRMFTGGVPARKIPTSGWSTTFGEWDPMVDTGFSDWKEDVKDDFINWIKKNTGQYSVGNFFNQGGDSPE